MVWIGAVIVVHNSCSLIPSTLGMLEQPVDAGALHVVGCSGLPA